MAFISVKEVSEGRTAEADFSNGFSTSYTQRFQVMTDNQVLLLDDVMLLAGQEAPGPDIIPSVGSIYRQGSSASVKGYSVQVIDPHYKYIVTVKYATPPSSGHGHDPTSLDWSFSTDVIEHEFTPGIDHGGHSDFDNYPAARQGNILNSANQPFTDVTEVEYWHVINLTKFIKKWSMQEEFERGNTINAADTPLLGYTFPKYTLLCSRWITNGRQHMEGGDYYRLNAQFIHRPAKFYTSDDIAAPPKIKEIPGWVQGILDAGYWELGDDDCKQLKLTEADGEPTLRLLNGAGKRQPCEKYKPVWLQFRTKESADMTAWGLPTTVPN